MMCNADDCELRGLLMGLALRSLGIIEQDEVPTQGMMACATALYLMDSGTPCRDRFSLLMYRLSVLHGYPDERQDKLYALAGIPQDWVDQGTPRT